MLANRGNATFNGYLSNIDLSGELCVHIWKDDTTHNEETFITSDQNWCREELTAERSLSDLSSNLHTEPDLFWGAGGESLSKILWNSLTLGQGLELTPEQFCAEAWAVILRVSHSEFPEPYWNTLSRCNGLHSSGMKIMPAHISEAWRGITLTGSRGHWALPKILPFQSWETWTFPSPTPLDWENWGPGR